MLDVTRDGDVGVLRRGRMMTRCVPLTDSTEVIDDDERASSVPSGAKSITSGPTPGTDLVAETCSVSPATPASDGRWPARGRGAAPARPQG